MYGYFVKLLNMSLASSVLILAVVAVRFLLRRTPKKLVCLLWLLVALRLMIPVSINSALSAFNYIGHYHRFDGQLSYIEYSGHAEKPEMEIHLMESVIRSDDGPTMVTHSAKMYLPTLMNIWVVGMAIMLVYAAVSYLRIYQHTRVSLRHRGNVYLCDSIPSPFILGLVSPRIYLPSGITREEARSVIAHERAHIARFDHIWKPLGYLILCVHWFNPFVWMAYILLCRDIEMACDEKVIAGMSATQKQEYSAVLLRCSTPQRIISACPLAFGEVGVKQRIKGILNYRKPTFWVVALALAACVALSAVFLTNPKKQRAVVDPLMGFDEYLPEGYSLKQQSGDECLLLHDGNTVGGVKFSLLEIPENKEPQVLTGSELEEIWAVFGIDFGNEYLECMMESSVHSDWMGWFGIYDPDTRTSTGEYHYLYLMPGAGYDLRVAENHENPEELARLFRNYLSGETITREEGLEATTATEPEIIVPQTPFPEDLVMIPGDDPKLGITDVIDVKTAYAVAPDGNHYPRYEYLVGQNCSLYVFAAGTVEGQPRWHLVSQDGNNLDKKLMPGVYPIYGTYVVCDPEVPVIPVCIEQTEPTTMDFPLPEGVTFDTLAPSNYPIIKGNKIVGELHRDIQIFDLLKNQNGDDIARYLSRGLQDGWKSEYSITYGSDIISANYTIIAETSGEQVQTGHWFFQKGRAAYELIFYYDMISHADADIIRKTMGVE